MSNSFPCLKIHGGLIGIDMIEQIAEGTAPGQRPSDFGFSDSRNLTDEIAAAWSAARSHWRGFQEHLSRLPETDLGTAITRDQWIRPLLSLLGYNVVYHRSVAKVDGKSYHIHYRAGQDEDAPPIHLVGFRQSLDHRDEIGPSRMAPHSLLQEYLNRTEHLWGIVTNGRSLRILRNSPLLHRLSYIEFDLAHMMQAEKFADFALLYRLAHRTRFPKKLDDAPECLLEKYFRMTVEQGGRVRDKLRDGVEVALKTFANGFLQHRDNNGLRQVVASRGFPAREFYRELLNLIYRLLFLMVTEERNLLTENDIYRDYYSVNRLRRLAETPAAYTEHGDLWLGLQTTFALFEREELGKYLGVPPLDGDLFSRNAVEHLNGLSLTNRALLTALWNLSMYRESKGARPRRINYAAMDFEELGSIYESLLDLEPVYRKQSDKILFDFVQAKATERKSTGSYYTPQVLVNELIKSALDPVLEQRLAQARTKDEKERAILSLTVCDPACGSGHFLLAAARRLGLELARVRSGDEEPSPEERRLAVREVITHCIYGVDKNPLAVDLCKVALWIEGHSTGKPLTFLDHRIRCGDSLVGVFDLSVLNKGIPDGAYKPVFGDDKRVARTMRNHNSRAIKRQRRLSMDLSKTLAVYSDARQALVEIPDDALEQVKKKAQAFRQYQQQGTDWWRTQIACNLWTSAFFVEMTAENKDSVRIPFTDDLNACLGCRSVDPTLRDWTRRLKKRLKFFHWPPEFPEVFQKGGFDIVLCNPPWERIKIQEKEFFSSRDPQIANALNKAARTRLIKDLQRTKPALWKEYGEEKHIAEATSKFLRESGRFPLSARGDINTYSVFTELIFELLNKDGRAGIVIPSGIATGDTNKHFFAHLVETGRMVSLYDFENREGIFPAVDKRYKFCLLTLRGRGKRELPADFGFFLTRTEHLHDERRVFTLGSDDFILLNPNTRTCPVFRTKQDAELTKKIYQRVPVLVDEQKRENPRGVRFMRMFDMANDSHLFKVTAQLEAEGYFLLRGEDIGLPCGPCFVKGDKVWVPLYEGKMIWQFDHRYGTYADVPPNTRNTHLPSPTPQEYADPEYFVLPRYWVPAAEVDNRLQQWNHDWLLGFRKNTNATNERTAIFAVLPRVGAGHTVPLLLPAEIEDLRVPLLLANLNCIVLEYLARSKIAGTDMNFFFLKQLAVLSPDSYSRKDLVFILPRVLELTYTSWDLKGFAKDLWTKCDGELRAAIAKGHDENAHERNSAAAGSDLLPPFVWNDDRRSVIRSELDAYYAHLYGLTRDELRYILDPKDVFGEDFPGETFRVLKEREEREYVEYRTKRLVLDAWDRLFG